MCALRTLTGLHPGLGRPVSSVIIAGFRRASSTLASQGLDANGLAEPEFTGTLLDITIADLVQTVALARKDGVITVTHGGTQSRIWCVGTGVFSGVPPGYVDRVGDTASLHIGGVGAYVSASSNSYTTLVPSF